MTSLPGEFDAPNEIPSSRSDDVVAIFRKLLEDGMPAAFFVDGSLQTSIACGA